MGTYGHTCACVCVCVLCACVHCVYVRYCVCVCVLCTVCMCVVCACVYCVYSRGCDCMHVCVCVHACAYVHGIYLGDRTIVSVDQKGVQPSVDGHCLCAYLELARVIYTFGVRTAIMAGKSPNTIMANLCISNRVVRKTNSEHTAGR